MTSTRDTWQQDPEDREVTIELQELLLQSSHKAYDLYRVACRLEQWGDVLILALVVKDDCVFMGDVMPLIKHSLHVAFAQLADATFSNAVDDVDERPKVSGPPWRLDLRSLRREPGKNAFTVDFGFRGPKKIRGQLTVISRCLDDAWSAVPTARGRAHDIVSRARVQTRSWKLTYEELEDL